LVDTGYWWFGDLGRGGLVFVGALVVEAGLVSLTVVEEFDAVEQGSA
jgi:hypothetical protein